MMTIDYALIRFSLWLSSLHQLDWHAAGALVSGWLAPLGWVNDRLLDLTEVPVIGVLAYIIDIPLFVIVALLAAVLTLTTVLVSGILAALAGAAVLALAHFMALIWTICHALGGV